MNTIIKDKEIHLLNGGGYDNLTKDAKIIISDNNQIYQISLSDFFSRIYDMVREEVNDVSGAALGLKINWKNKEELQEYI